MYQHNEIDRLKTEFNTKQIERRKTLKSAWGILLLIAIVLVVIFIFAFPNQFKDGETAWILPTYGGVALLILLIGYLSSIRFISEKPVFITLYKSLYDKINMDEGLYLEYEAYSKTAKAFNKEGALFTPYASGMVRRHVKGVSSNDNNFNIYDCILRTSSGQNSTTHFNGVYIALDKTLNTTLQIRSNGSPKRKGTKFDKQEEYTEFKVYKPQGQNMTSLDHTLVQFMTGLKQDLNYRRLYLSVQDNKVNLALWYKKHPARKINSINIDVVNAVYTYFLSELELVNKLEQFGEY